MYLENIVFDAVDPQALGREWEERLGTEQLTDAEGIYETRLAVADGGYLDLCFPQVPADQEPGPDRLHLDLDDRGASLLAIRLEVADPERDHDFWTWLTGWVPVAGDVPSLQHPSQRGPVLRLTPEATPKTGGKNRIHLDVRLEAGDDPDEVAEEIAARGGQEQLHPEWGELPWRTYSDPSGNEFCVLRGPDPAA